MTGALAGRVVLVTGSSRGIGAEVAVKAAAEGADGRRPLPARRPRPPQARSRGSASAGGDGETFAADIGDGAEARGARRARSSTRFGRIDGLVNNAGRTLVGPFLEIEPAEWDEVIATDLTAAFHTCRAALPSMVERGSGVDRQHRLAARARWASPRPPRTAPPRPG